MVEKWIVMLNSTQKNIIDGTIIFMLEPLIELNPDDAVKALKGIIAVSIEEEEIDLFEQQDVWDCIASMRRIMSHPCPENRNESYPYVDQQEGFCMYKIDRSSIKNITEQGIFLLNSRFIPKEYIIRNSLVDEYFIAKEPNGLLGLTSREDNETGPVTKKDIVEYIKQQVMIHFSEQLKKLEGKIQPEISLPNDVVEREVTNNQPNFFLSVVSFKQLISQSSLADLGITEDMIKSHWQPPHTFNSWGVQAKNFTSQHLIQTLEYLINVEKLSFADSMNLVNNFDISEFEVIQKLYSKGLRREHLIDLKEHEHFHNQHICLLLDALTDLVLNSNTPLKEAIITVKNMDNNDLSMYLD